MVKTFFKTVNFVIGLITLLLICGWFYGQSQPQAAPVAKVTAR